MCDNGKSMAIPCYAIHLGNMHTSLEGLLSLDLQAWQQGGTNGTVMCGGEGGPGEGPQHSLFEDPWPCAFKRIQLLTFPLDRAEAACLSHMRYVSTSNRKKNPRGRRWSYGSAAEALRARVCLHRAGIVLWCLAPLSGDSLLCWALPELSVPVLMFPEWDSR